MKKNLLSTSQKFELSPILMFCDGKQIFQKYLDEFKVHKKGYFILAPSGSGKTYFIKNQKEKHWIDGDKLWEATYAHPDYRTVWWKKGIEIINEIDQRSDIITKQAKKLGLWILGASNYWLKPDAVVIPDFRIQKKYIQKREVSIEVKRKKDGGATSEDFDQVLSHRKWIRKTWLGREKVPCFKSVQDATAYCEKLYEAELHK